ncbi:diguanylate cyclase [Burkholderia sp. PAMC 28687]|jgi:diguanylate cyclase (GGDEF)-like protein|uniref:Diguanylate cyclase/phosphodiesterase (GGDEF & EAL protein) with PAS/PAC sensor(S) n=1 Tax=Caballeronia sordidicola TaxID=196367 RepID=A0A242N2B3_CABSO|nr:MULTISPECIES: EAL domain-containing protein [Burkholderiaceae]AMM16677.1 diguanylate cyclase [Burkholderia sp. PAMC 28687]OTP77818.1 diguanylate cyclase/phosphodiesterase (GGDEF & EAL protein) with PAS/PAC sensor(s) [Caballeronia sordidicola]
MAFSEPQSPFFKWLVGSAQDLSADNRQVLLSNLFTRTTSIVMASICELSVCLTALYLYPGAGYLAWTLAVLVVLAARLLLIAVCCRRSERNEPTPTSLFLVASIVWSAVLGLGALLCNISGNQTLFLLGNVCAVGVVGGLAGRNAGTPRLVMIQISFIFALLGLGAAMSPGSGKIVLLFQAPFCAAGFFTVALRSNKDTVAMLRAQETSNRLARHDSLTGLPNRARISELLLNRTDAEPALRPGSFAVLLIDLDGFKAINDSLGHAAGDLVLQESARRLRAVLRQGDIVGRLAGDEFVAISNDASLSEEVRLLADQIVKTLARPFVLNDALVRIGASVGISQYPEHGDTGPQLLICADRALYAVKRSGKSAFAVFDAQAHASDDSLSLLRSDLEGALQAFGSGLRMEYQAIVNLASGVTTGREALVRWTHPTRGELPPTTFVPIAERTGLILPLGEWVLRRSCEEAAGWREPVVVAVNVSPVQLREETFADLVASVLREYDMAPSRLNIEVTETVLMSDDGPTRRNVERLRAMGIGLALDDFGTGFSTLSNLCRFSFDTLKIDSSFVRESVHRRESAAVVRGIVALARELGIPTTAEGIETDEQLAFVRGCGCTSAQGFFLGRPERGERIAGVTV